MTRLEAIHDKTDANQMRVEHETELLRAMKAMLAKMNGNIKSNLEKSEANRKADQDSLARMESQTGSLVSRKEADRKYCREKLRATSGADYEATEVYPEKMEPNPGEREAVVEWQEIPNEEAEIHALKACLPRNDGGTCGMRGANLSGHGI
jgi:hypothetical protein